MAKIEIPFEGIYNEDGFLFHHVGTAPLSADMITRLHEYGTGYQHGTRFKADEDDIIRQNWNNYKKENKLDDSSVLELIGAGSRKCKGKQDDKARNRELGESNFWPKMCKGLPHRSAHQVRQRMAKLYDKFIVDIAYSKHNSLNFSKLMDFIKAYNSCGHMRTAAEVIAIIAKVILQYVGLPADQCISTYSRYLERRGDIKQTDWKSFWNTISNCQKSEKTTKDDFKKNVGKLVKHNDKERLEQLEIDFEKISRRSLRSKKRCKQAWGEISATLVNKYNKYFSKMNDKEAAWNKAYKKTLGIEQPITPTKFVLFLRILHDCIQKDVEYVPFKKTHCDMTALTLKMIESGISGFSKDKNVAYATSLIKKVQQVLARCEELIFRKLAFKFTVKERIKIISLTFDRQIENDMKEEDTVPGETKMKSSTGRCGFTLLRTPSFIEALILFTTELSPDWIPPTALKKYVEDEEVLRLFPDHKDNSALLSKKMLREYEALDEHQLFAKRRKLE